MKKILFTISAIALLIMATAPTASAWDYFKYKFPYEYRTNPDANFTKYYSYSRHGSRYVDHGDAVGYQDTTHTTDGWQRLGTYWGCDDGVAWSTDGGQTWGHDCLYVGDEVMFRFDFQRTNDGLHDYDVVKAWVDWDVDKEWDNDTEMVYAQKWYANYTKQNLDADHVYTLQKYFYTESFVVPESAIGTTWLRARVHCTETAFEDIDPYMALSQGEVEDWQLCVKATPTPEPATVALLGIGLLGVAGYARKRTKK